MYLLLNVAFSKSESKSKVRVRVRIRVRIPSLNSESEILKFRNSEILKFRIPSPNNFIIIKYNIVRAQKKNKRE